MGLLDWLFSGGPLESAAKGGMIGAAIGERAQDAEDRQEIIKQLRIQNANITYQNELAEARRQMAVADEFINERSAARKGWVWSWDMTAYCGKIQVYDNFFKRMEEPEFKKINTKLYLRWSDLYERSLRVGIMPLTFMPRTRYGDVAGSERTLTYAMDRLEQRVLQYENLKIIENKFEELT